MTDAPNVIRSMPEHRFPVKLPGIIGKFTVHSLGTCGVKVVYQKIKNMTGAPKPKKDNAGKFPPNGAQVKAELNKAILTSAWGKVRLFTTYKAIRVNKLVLVVPPHHTSQERSKCSHTDPDNRKEQAVFECQNCGFTSHADANVTEVIKRRGIQMLLAGEIDVKVKRNRRCKEIKSH